VLSRLQAEAHAKRQSLEAYVLSRLAKDAVPEADVSGDDSLLFLIEQIKATPTPLGMIDPPENQDVSELLATTKVDPNFDWEAYDKEWSKFEAELKALEKADAEADLARDGILT